MSQNLRPLLKCATQDPAQRALVKLRGLCCAITAATGMRHDQIADAIGAKPRTLTTWKSGTTIPHWVIDELERVLGERTQKAASK